MTSDIHIERTAEVGADEEAAHQRRTGAAVIAAGVATVAAIWTWIRRRRARQETTWAKAAKSAREAATPAAKQAAKVSKKAVRKARSRAAEVIKP